MPTKRRGTNTRAVGATVAALKASGRLEKVDSALVALARVTAAQLDAVEDDVAGFSPASMASLVRAHLAVLKQMVGGRDDSDALDDLLAQLQAPILDAEDR